MDAPSNWAAVCRPMLAGHLRRRALRSPARFSSRAMTSVQRFFTNDVLRLKVRHFLHGVNGLPPSQGTTSRMLDRFNAERCASFSDVFVFSPCLSHPAGPRGGKIERKITCLSNPINFCPCSTHRKSGLPSSAAWSLSSRVQARFSVEASRSPISFICSSPTSLAWRRRFRQGAGGRTA